VFGSVYSVGNTQNSAQQQQQGFQIHADSLAEIIPQHLVSSALFMITHHILHKIAATATKQQ